MLFRIGIENGVEGRSLAWALEHPGCFAYGRSGEEALDNLESAIQEHLDWIASNDVQLRCFIHHSHLRRLRYNLDEYCHKYFK
jgi:hypothetical protein